MSVSNKITLKHVVNILKDAYHSPKMPTVLGRWIRYDDDDERVKLKVHYSNEDHCGTCSEYSLEKLTYTNMNTEKIMNNSALLINKTKNIAYVSPIHLQLPKYYHKK
jgi:hypothetical protein